MDKKPKRLDPDFIGKPAAPQANLIRMPDRGLAPGGMPPGIPDVFDENRIRYELQKVAGTPGVGKYIAALKARFSSKQERTALEAWEKFYSQAQKTVQSHTDFVRAQHDHQQVEREYEIKNKQKDLASMSLDADMEEQRLRLDMARAARRELQEVARQPAANDQNRGQETATLLDQWYQQTRRQIMDDPSLTLDEQDHLLEQLKAEYRARKQQVTIDIG